MVTAGHTNDPMIVHWLIKGTMYGSAFAVQRLMLSSNCLLIATLSSL